ncbi:MAG: NUDIX domain-containing protein [Mycobacteriales bacterium]
MPRRSAGLLVWRRREQLEVLLAHPGGPLHASRDVWGIPKGELEPGENPLAAAYREFTEELGLPVPPGPPVGLGDVVQKGGKIVTAWALEGDVDVAAVRPGMFGMEWPPRSGRQQSFPEVDRAEWFELDTARRKILPAQEPLLDRLVKLHGRSPGASGRDLS